MSSRTTKGSSRPALADLPAQGSGGEAGGCLPARSAKTRPHPGLHFKQLAPGPADVLPRRIGIGYRARRHSQERHGRPVLDRLACRLRPALTSTVIDRTPTSLLGADDPFSEDGSDDGHGFIPSPQTIPRRPTFNVLHPHRGARASPCPPLGYGPASSQRIAARADAAPKSGTRESKSDCASGQKASEASQAEGAKSGRGCRRRRCGRSRRGHRGIGSRPGRPAAASRES